LPCEVVFVFRLRGRGAGYAGLSEVFFSSRDARDNFHRSDFDVVVNSVCFGGGGIPSVHTRSTLLSIARKMAAATESHGSSALSEKQKQQLVSAIGDALVEPILGKFSVLHLHSRVQALITPRPRTSAELVEAIAQVGFTPDEVRGVLCTARLEAVAEMLDAKRDKDDDNAVFSTAGWPGIRDFFRTPTNDVLNICSTLGSGGWSKFAVDLGIDITEQLRINIEAQRPTHRGILIITMWLQRSVDPTWDVLLGAMRNTSVTAWNNARLIIEDLGQCSFCMDDPEEGVSLRVFFSIREHRDILHFLDIDSGGNGWVSLGIELGFPLDFMDEFGTCTGSPAVRLVHAYISRLDANWGHFLRAMFGINVPVYRAIVSARAKADA